MDECIKNLPDKRLAERIRDGDSQAFVVLVRRYERSLAALIGHRLATTGAVDAVEDLLQETFVQAWAGLGSLAPRDVRAWLYQVARNRCNDYLRSPQRRERFVDDDALATMVNRMGAVDAQRRRAAANVVEAFEVVPERERQALESFYVDGLSIAEIAARHRVPPGTVKRRLSHGRDRVRGEMGIAINRRKTGMNTDSRAEPGPFPTVRPDIVVERLEVKASPVDLRELTWWFVIPELDDEVRWAEYQPTGVETEWRLTRSTAMRTAGPAVIHDRDCVAIEVDEVRYPVDGLVIPTDRHTKVWGRLTETDVEWVAVEQAASDGTRRLDTFLDDGFDQDWGACARRIEAGEWLVAAAESNFGRQPGIPAVFADGVYTVQVGERTFTCTRIVEMEKETTELDVVVLAYVDTNGRTVLFRRYDGNRRTTGSESQRREDLLPYADRLVIDGMTFIHSYDYITAAACGLDG